MLGGVAAVGAASVSLTACGSTSSDSPAGGASDSAAAGDTAGGGNGDVSVPVADVPVGGGKILKADKVVVTQPAAGQFKAFSAVCTHQGCIVSKIDDDGIYCACHGSRFAIADGAVQNGPAEKPLPAKTATKNGANITVT